MEQQLDNDIGTYFDKDNIDVDFSLLEMEQNWLIFEELDDSNKKSRSNSLCDEIFPKEKELLTQKVVALQSSFRSQYFRNDRKNIQCFPDCATKFMCDSIGPAKLCRADVFAHVTLPYPLHPSSQRIEAYGMFAMFSTNLNEVCLENGQVGRIPAKIKWVSSRSIQLVMSPRAWKYDHPLSKKKIEETHHNQCYFIVVVLLDGNEIGRDISSPFRLSSHKAYSKRKRYMFASSGPFSTITSAKHSRFYD
jgi:hypothetical protein